MNTTAAIEAQICDLTKCVMVQIQKNTHNRQESYQHNPLIIKQVVHEGVKK